MLRTLLVAVVASTMALAAPARADDDRAPSIGESLEEAEDMARESVEKLIGALKKLMYAIPQYKSPEILDNGDIIIRRVPRRGDRKPRPEDKEPPPPDTKWL